MIDRAARRATLEELEVLAELSAEHFRDTWRLPGELPDLWRDPGHRGWAGPYLRVFGTDPRTGREDAEVDGWAFEYVLTRHGDSVLEITSPGADGRVGELDDWSVTVDVTSLRRERTLERLAILNDAIRSYNRAYLGSDDLSPPFPGVLSRLVARGYLPSAEPFRTDGWGDDFECDPPAGVPVVRVRSHRLSN
jgi:hypothetical protein